MLKEETEGGIVRISNTRPSEETDFIHRDTRMHTTETETDR